MKFVVEELAIWIKPEQRQIKESNWFDSSVLNLSWVPAMQRRRMTSFIKMALFSAHQVSTQGNYVNLPSVFSSRHGDFHKTSNLLVDVVNDQPLSPTGFGLSVHNAASGLFGIIQGNTSATNAIAAGAESFIYALVDGFVRLADNDQQHMLIVHTDETLPDIYAQYADEQQIAHSIGLIIRAPQKGEPHFSLNKVFNTGMEKSDLPMSIQCAKALYERSNILLVHNTLEHDWQLTYHA
ncbi:MULTISPECIES: beta-ketoacyl synthase chain length factor [Pseudoalteromonas]|uniref:beta-ketoacyl synthase chain length factor n=1 Tax=Pseudoalteromonas TaxID=53246 RepID=UPI0015F5851A|nr:MULTISPECIES: beta-ketoacyl synthase chain length factor [Pseudoalteromonas]MBA6409813.1 beta-ketoacyl synthase chain length factor [Pseudoalteromonas sp. 5Ae-yellow]MDN3392780.1 beta-ketoacyl synthase chain length factor [Pseudoalteromonas sp. APC 3691]